MRYKDTEKKSLNLTFCGSICNFLSPPRSLQTPLWYSIRLKKSSNSIQILRIDDMSMICMDDDDE